MSHRTHQLLANLILLGVSLLVALAAGELTLRLAPGLLSEEARLRLSWQEQRLSHAARTRPDSAIGFLYAPSSHDVVHQGEVRFSYATDREGFRNSAAEPDSAEIVAVGDSWTFGFGVDDSVAWPRLLADSLRLRVRNLGLIASGPGQYTLVLRRFGLPLHPRVVLYGLFPGNDLDDQEAFDRWERDGRQGNFAEWRTYGARGHSQPLWEGSYLLVAVEEGWKYRHERFAGSTIRLADGSPMQLAPGRLLPKAERSHPGDSTFDHVLAAVDRARAMADEQHARTVVLVFPTKEEVYLPLRHESAPPLTSRWVAALRERGLDCLDLTGPLREHAGGAPLYYEVDGHVNAAGNRVIAATVASYLGARRDELGLSPSR
jgi:GDSL-like lipase/acylhydrolase family protein